MLLVLSRNIFIENETAKLCVTMWKRSRGITGLMWFIKLFYRYHSVEIK